MSQPPTPADTSPAPEEPTTSTQIVLRCGYAAESHESHTGSSLLLKTPEGQVFLTIRFGPEGPVVELKSATLSIAAEGDMRLSGERIALEARSDMAISCGGNLALHAEGELASQARSQHHRATHGDLSLKANDDLRLDGERIGLNSPPEAPGPRNSSPHVKRLSSPKLEEP